MEYVICDSIGSTHLCNGCGAAKPHYNSHCEPCPINKEAKCKPVDLPEPQDEEEPEFEPCGKCDGHDACADFGCAYSLGLGHMVDPGTII